MKLGDLVFVYGTLRVSGDRHSLLSGRTRLIQEDYLARVRLYNITEGSFPFPGLILSGSIDDSVVGDVLEIADPNLPATLDRYEGYPSLYSRHRVLTEGGYDCWVYTWNGDVSEERRIPSGDWLNR